MTSDMMERTWHYHGTSTVVSSRSREQRLYPADALANVTETPTMSPTTEHRPPSWVPWTTRTANTSLSHPTPDSECSGARARSQERETNNHDRDQPHRTGQHGPARASTGPKHGMACTALLSPSFSPRSRSVGMRASVAAPCGWVMVTRPSDTTELVETCGR